MKLKGFFHDHERIVMKMTEKKTELICEIIPVADWYLFKTNHDRYFTCEDRFTHENDGKKWSDVEFDSIEEGKHYPFE